MMRRLFRFLGIAAAGLAGLLVLGGGFFGVVVLSREPLEPSRSTTHPSIDRQSCLDCHAPIAQEWRRSFHYQSLNGPYWKDVRDLGYLKIFDLTRKACVNCHAPANVLDLGASSPSAAGENLGVECTPNLLHEPAGTIPAARSDQVELGVDCTSCHVSRRGVVGAGDHPTEAHATVADPRFQSAALASRGLCRTCHRATVEAWERTSFAREGITCLDCHMPETNGASVAGGPERRRRAHSFVGDKDPAMLERAVNASLAVTADRRARFRIRNDRVGHFLPSGGNWLSVELKALDASGRLLTRRVEGFGKDEALILDFWPYNRDGRIASGEEKEVLLPLPAGHGTVEAVVRYHDWMKVKRTVATLKEVY
jgi:nitrate/TMAO reductase-like tetraheme cytochrome c subunit